MGQNGSCEIQVHVGVMSSTSLPEDAKMRNANTERLFAGHIPQWVMFCSAVIATFIFRGQVLYSEYVPNSTLVKGRVAVVHYALSPYDAVPLFEDKGPGMTW